MFLTKKEIELIKEEIRLLQIYNDHFFYNHDLQIASLELTLLHDQALWENEIFESQREVI